MPANSTEILSPELIKIFKIFGLSSILFVLVLSFFNEKKANNASDMDSILRMANAERIYFKNVRGIFYDIEGRQDAQMTVYRYGKRIQESDLPIINLAIILNRVKDEAYIYVEPNFEQLPIKIRWKIDNQNTINQIEFAGGDKFEHFRFVQDLLPIVESDVLVELWFEDSWVLIWKDPKERDALRIPIRDFHRLINHSK